MAAESGDAFSQDEEGVVDVPGFLQPLAKCLGFVASFRSSQITDRESENACVYTVFTTSVPCDLLSYNFMSGLPSTEKPRNSSHIKKRSKSKL